MVGGKPLTCTPNVKGWLSAASYLGGGGLEGPGTPPSEETEPLLEPLRLGIDRPFEGAGSTHAPPPALPLVPPTPPLAAGLGPGPSLAGRTSKNISTPPGASTSTTTLGSVAQPSTDPLASDTMLARPTSISVAGMFECFTVAVARGWGLASFSRDAWAPGIMKVGSDTLTKGSGTPSTTTKPEKDRLRRCWSGVCL